MGKYRHVIVTGGSRGLGAAMIEGLLQDGYRVSTCSRTRSQLIDDLSKHEEYRSRFFWSSCQVNNPDEATRFIDEALNAAGADGVWGLVNNAGVAQQGILATFPNVESEKIIQINLLGALYMCRAVSQYLLKSSAGGRIVNISSIIGTQEYNGLAAYSASKAGMDGLTRALARELGRRQITVNSLAPGYVLTEMSSSLNQAQLTQIVNRTPLGRLPVKEDILAALRFLLSDAAGMITGQTLLVDGGVSC